VALQGLRALLLRLFLRLLLLVLFELLGEDRRGHIRLHPIGHGFGVLLFVVPTTGQGWHLRLFLLSATQLLDLHAQEAVFRFTLTQLLVTLSEELAALPNLHLAINLSATSLDDPTFIPFLEELLDSTSVAPERLTFEITETTVVNQLSSASELLARIRQKGSKVALDDFGSGFSSFNYLKHFQVDFIKIDGSFVRNLLNSSVDRTIVESISGVAHRLGVKTVAEYVEDIAMIPVLEEAGVDFVQGYAIGRPQPLTMLFEQLVETSLLQARLLRLVNRDA